MKFAVPIFCMSLSAALLACFGALCHFVLPVCIGYFEGMSLILPLPTQILIASTKFIRTVPALGAFLGLVLVALIGAASTQQRVGKVVAGLGLLLCAGLAAFPYFCVQPFARLLSDLGGGPTPGMFELYELGLAQRDLSLKMIPSATPDLEKPVEVNYQVVNSGSRPHRIGHCSFFAPKRADFSAQSPDSDALLEPGQKLEGHFTVVFHSRERRGSVSSQAFGILSNNPACGVYFLPVALLDGP